MYPASTHVFVSQYSTNSTIPPFSFHFYIHRGEHGMVGACWVMGMWEKYGKLEVGMNTYRACEGARSLLPSANLIRISNSQ